MEEIKLRIRRQFDRKCYKRVSDKNSSTEEICKHVLQSLVDQVVMKLNKTRVQYCDVPGCPTRGSVEKVNYHYFPKAGSGQVTITNELGKTESVDKVVAWEKALQMTGGGSTDAGRVKVCCKHFLKTDYMTTDRTLLKKNTVPLPFCPPKPSTTDDLEAEVPDYVAFHKVKLKTEPKEEPIYEINDDSNNEIKEEPIHEIKEELFDIVMDELDLKEEFILDPLRELPPVTGSPEPQISTIIPDADPLIISPIPELEPPTRNINPEPELLIRSEIPELEPPARNRTPAQELSTRTNVPISQPILLWPTATEIPEALGPKTDTRCAICLSNQASHNNHEIQNGITILKMLELCTGYKMEMQEQTLLPGICDICCTELLISNHLREKFWKSQNILKSKRNEIACFNSEEAIFADTSNYALALPSPMNVIAPSDDVLIEVCLESDASIEKNICTPLECFENFMGDVLEKITQCTNKTIRARAKSTAGVQKETCKEEMRALIGMLVYSGTVKSVNKNEEEVYNCTFMGTKYEFVISGERFKYLLETLTFYGGRSKAKTEMDEFTQFMHGVWNSFMDKCRVNENSTSTVTKVEHYLICDTPCPVQRFRLGNSSYVIKMLTHFDSTHRFFLKSYPFTGNDPQQLVNDACDPETKSMFGRLWYTFYSSQNSPRWSVVLFYAMLNIALINSYSMHCLRSVDVKLSEEVFLKRLIDSLVMPWVKASESVICLNKQVAKYRCYQNKRKIDQATKRLNPESIKSEVVHVRLSKKICWK